ncbi:MAG: hypothetical protein UY72_C0080G0015 [Candidatus Uhrbacteria bacterium GW2011_GWD2_52_7]|uniref:Uncharacterized protein n=1 Tax=Candidatus Uhrbacteria bacterium GW2011_GWD2_52_7 TaxID=1618989 RepID=A0A0G1ZJP1_9BACT|nr:MAG: hypothetical protein UY72_C0080G0015 [Candidatus Uhrbacteria bacterium GW2011_GWD2_52_7]
MTKGSSLILRIYFGVVSAVTLFTLMYGAIDMLTIGLKTYVITAADMPSYGLVNCDSPDAQYQFGSYTKPIDGGTTSTTVTLTPDEMKARCEASNETTMENYRREKANNAVRDIATVLVSLPLFITHFRVVYRDWTEERKEKA